MSVLRWQSIAKALPNRQGTKYCSRTLFTKSTATKRSPLRTGIYASVFAVSAGLFAVYYFDARSALHRYIITPTLRYTLDPETSHKLAVKLLRSGLCPRDPIQDDARLKIEMWDEEISNPIGIAAGFDKDGEAIDGLFGLGFSWVEVGSVTPKPQPGNPRPRVFHLPEDNGVINRYGFPSQGHTAVVLRLRARIPSFSTGKEQAALRDGALLAVNLGKNKESSVDSIDDFLVGVRVFGPYSDVLVVNVSSPNTPGLRGFQSRELLERLLDGVTKERDALPPSSFTQRRPKLLLKLAPDLDESQIEGIANVISKSSIDGVIVSNTTVQRPSHLISLNKSEVGGLSGAPVKSYSMKTLQILRKHLPASIPLIGCGGISSGADALDYAKAGASLVQIYTGFGYDGVGACRRIKDELLDELAKEKTTWGEVVKSAVEELSLKETILETNKGDDRALGQLISEAEELKGLLDKLGAKMGEDSTTV